VYDSIQAIVGNDGSSVQDCITDLWESFNELTKEYTTTVAGGYLRENAVSFISELDSIGQQLDKLQNELDTEVKNTVKKINDYSDQIAELNDQITRAEADGSLACELRDSRDSIIASLSELVEVSVENATDTCVNIRTANGYLVVRTHANMLSTDQIIPESTFCSPIWAETGEEFEAGSGELKGILDMRGGHVVGNLEHSSNGAPKEQMDVVVSIDTDMDHKSIDDMFRNINNMIDILDRQSANYKLYLTDGTEVTGKQLKAFMEHLYSESIIDEIDGNISVSGLIKNLKNLYGIDSQSVSDVWSYVEKNGGSFNDINNLKDTFEEYVKQKETDTEKLDEMVKLIEEYLDSLDDGESSSLKGFSKFLNSKSNTSVVESLENHLNDYVDDIIPVFDENNIKDYITNDLHGATGVIPSMLTSNSDNVLANVSKATLINFRPDSNKYFMVFTDNEITNPITKNDAAARMNALDMRLIAVTNEESRISWRELAQETNGNVIDISGFESLEGTENIALTLARDFNSRLVGEGIESGITSFRAGLNALLNGFAKEINGIFRQGANTYGERHGVVKDAAGNVVYDPETGDPMYNNFDLFLKIDDKLPLQMGNVRINPVFTDVNKLPLSLTGNTGDFQIGNKLVDLAYTDIYNSGDSYSTLDEYYSNFILDFAQAANAATVGYETQNKVLTVASEKIQTISGVSMDEELSNMVKFQYSYTAASKMINVVDEMLETIMRL